MKGIKATAVLVLCLALIIAVVLPAIAGEQRSALLKQYWGTITSIRIDRCGKRPGLCEGAIILARREGGEVTLAIRPGPWMASFPNIPFRPATGRLSHTSALRLLSHTFDVFL
jgi:hypothetical protein